MPRRARIASCLASGKPVDVLRRRDLRQQRRRRHALRDRLGRGPLAGHVVLAGPARVRGTDLDLDVELGRSVDDPLGALLAEALQRMARVVRADLLVVVEIAQDLDPGEVIGKGPSPAPTAPMGRDLDRFFGRRRIDQDLGLVEQAGLLPGLAPLAAGATEALALQQANVLGEAIVLGLVLDHGLLEASLLRLLQKHQRPQLLDRIGKICGHRGHEGHRSGCVAIYNTLS